MTSRLVFDLRSALRMMRRAPGFVAVVFAILTAGIGVTTAMFSIVSALFLRPLPFSHAEELMTIRSLPPSRTAPGPMALADALDLRARSSSLEALAAMWPIDFSVRFDAGPPEVVQAACVTGDFFRVMETTPLHGRLLEPEDDRAGGSKVLVLSAELWRRRLGSDPAVIGRSLSIDGDTYVVVGVAAEGFGFCGSSNDTCAFWTPLAPARADFPSFSNERGSRSFEVVARRKEGVALAQARVDLEANMARLAEEHPDTNEGWRVQVMDLREVLFGSSRREIYLLFAAVGLVFAVVCANVAGLFLARAMDRRTEIVTRVALGATRGRLVTQLVTETVVVFFVAGCGGAVLARAIVGWFVDHLVRSAAVANVPVEVDVRALAFSLAIAVAAGTLAGLVPALEAARVAPQSVLMTTRATPSGAQRWLRSALVVVQIAFAFALLVEAGRVTRDFARTAARDPGFDPSQLASGYLVLPVPRYADPSMQRTFVRELVARVGARPGVESVALSSSLPMSGMQWNGGFRIEGRPPPQRVGPALERAIVTAGFFETMRIPILRGRGFTAADTRDAPAVMVISQRAAEQFFPGEDPIGLRVDWGDHDDDVHEWREIVGVAGDVRRRGLELDAPPESYAVAEQHTTRWIAILARTTRGPELLAELPAIVAEIDPTIGVDDRVMLADAVAGTIGPARYTAVLLGAFAVAALVLATVGLFGLVSYAMSQRTRELGIRLALGATPGDLVRLVLRDGAALLAPGLALGVAVSLVRPLDPAVAIVVFFALALAGLGATLVPALRAARMSPAAALKTE
ncbi:MAG: ABC transporter permease [Labilithrix sp.]|nr:ABC transporter permease [Labilithrix sp.]MCW5814842.1 ABC transporter permease [Labilithrix sp.]